MTTEQLEAALKWILEQDDYVKLSTNTDSAKMWSLHSSQDGVVGVGESLAGCVEMATQWYIGRLEQDLARVGVDELFTIEERKRNLTDRLSAAPTFETPEIDHAQ